VPGTQVFVSAVPEFTVLLAGHEIVGGLVSSTVTVNVQLAPFSSDCEMIECVPTVKNVPDAGLLVTAPQLPEGAAAPKLTTAPG
jgi:hypothetical protein